MGDLGILPYPGATGTTGTQICSCRLSHNTTQQGGTSGGGGGGGGTSHVKQERNQTVRIKVQSMHKVSAGLGPQRVQGRSMGSHPSIGVRK